MELLTLSNKFKEKFNIENISKLKNELLKVCLNHNLEIFAWYINLIDNDLETDYLQCIFQYYEADRKEKMQDYTPKSLARLVCELTKINTEKWIYDCCSGSGALSIQKWCTNKSLNFVCEELDENVIPFLLFNLSVRNINAYVINKNILTYETYKVYEVKSSDKYSFVKEIEKDVTLPDCDVSISNPPYNIPFETKANIFRYGMPPKSNANYGFIQLCIDKAKTKSALILPNSVLTTDNKVEKEIRKSLINNNVIDSVIMCPVGMFEATSIPVCILLLNHNKKDKNIEFIDMRQTFIEDTRLQNGQFGSASHTNRTYKKAIKVFSEDHIKLVIDCINNRQNTIGLCKCESIDIVSENDYKLTPNRYVEMKEQGNSRREYKDILNDLNRIIKQKNLCKLTINETLARNVGFDIEFYKSDKSQSISMSDELKKIENLIGGTIEKSDYITFTKNKNEIIFSNNSKEDVSHILTMIFQQWKSFIFYLNLEENRYLAELRDALLPELLSGEIKL